MYVTMCLLKHTIEFMIIHYATTCYTTDLLTLIVYNNNTFHLL